MAASVLLPLPFGPMMAWTSPALMVRLMPLRMTLFSTRAWRFLISSNGFISSISIFRWNIVLCAGDVIIHPSQFDRGLVHVIDHIRRLRIVVARLADTADVHKIFLARVHLELRVSAAAHLVAGRAGFADERQGHVRVTKKTHTRFLIKKAWLRIKRVKDILPALRGI